MKELHDDEVEVLLRQQFEGPLADDGFSERVMSQLPPRRVRTAWTLWLGVPGGLAASCLSLVSAPLLHTGWRNWLSGELSDSVIGLWATMAAVSLLALVWSLAENRD